MEASSAVGKIHRGRRSQEKQFKGLKEDKKKKKHLSEKGTKVWSESQLQVCPSYAAKQGLMLKRPFTWFNALLLPS